MLLTAALLLAAAPVDLTALFVEAWEHSPDVLRARGALQDASAGRAGAGVLLPNPSLSASVGSDAPIENDGELDVDVGIQQELRWPGLWLARTAAGDADVLAARARLSAVRLGVAADVEAAVGAVLAAQEARVAWEELLAIARAMNDSAQRKLAAGAIGGLEAALIAADAATAEAAAIAARAQRAEADARLCAVLGRSPCVPLVAAVTDATDASADWPTLVGLDALDANDNASADAKAARADVRAAAYEKIAATERLSAAEQGWIPSARVGLGYTFERSQLHIPGIAAHVGDDDQLLSVSLGVTLPVFDRRQQDVLAARAELTRADAAARDAQLRRAGGVAGARTSLDAATETIDRMRAVQGQIAGALRDLERAYEAGALPLDDALTARDRLLQARLGFIDAQRRRMVAHAALLKLSAQPALLGISDDDQAQKDTP